MLILYQNIGLPGPTARAPGDTAALPSEGLNVIPGKSLPVSVREVVASSVKNEFIGGGR